MPGALFGRKDVSRGTLFSLPALGRQAPELWRMTRDELHRCTKKDLAELARKRGIAGWHRMRKEELLEALRAQARRRNGKAAAGHSSGRRTAARTQVAAARNTSGN